MRGTRSQGKANSPSVASKKSFGLTLSGYTHRDERAGYTGPQDHSP